MTNKGIDSLKEIIRTYERVIVAFSGGTDSTFLLKMCVETLGSSNVIAATAVSATYTPKELAFTKETAGEMRVKHIIIHTDEINDEEFTANTGLRCYHCKKNFYTKLREAAEKENIPVIVDGTNSDDDGDYRPGRTAAAEQGIQSPLMEAGISKDEIRRLSRSIGLQSWDRPANPCLASRVPYGSRITAEKLETIARAEEFMRDMGFRTVRVRHHDTIARIELPKPDLLRFMENNRREEAHRYFKELGFTWITLDIGGYRMGSMNESLAHEKEKRVK